jgi:hypothetical protein
MVATVVMLACVHVHVRVSCLMGAPIFATRLFPAAAEVEWASPDWTVSLPGEHIPSSSRPRAGSAADQEPTSREAAAAANGIAASGGGAAGSQSDQAGWQARRRLAQAYSGATSPNDPYFRYQLHLPAMNAPAAWKLAAVFGKGAGGANVRSLAAAASPGATASAAVL